MSSNSYMNYKVTNSLNIQKQNIRKQKQILAAVGFHFCLYKSFVFHIIVNVNVKTMTR